MIGRYTRPEMGAVWSEQRKLETWLDVELAVTDALAEQGVVPVEDAARVRDDASFTASTVNAARSRTCAASSSGTTPSSVSASTTASSTSSQVSSFRCSDQTAPISGRV